MLRSVSIVLISYVWPSTCICLSGMPVSKVSKVSEWVLAVTMILSSKGCAPRLQHKHTPSSHTYDRSTIRTARVCKAFSESMESFGLQPWKVHFTRYHFYQIHFLTLSLEALTHPFSWQEPTHILSALAQGSCCLTVVKERKSISPASRHHWRGSQGHLSRI